MGPQLRTLRYNIIVIRDGFQGALNWAMIPGDTSILDGSTPDICKSSSLGVIVALYAMFASMFAYDACIDFEYCFCFNGEMLLR